MDFQFPLFANPLAVLALSIVFAIVFYLILVRLWPLGKIGWKKSDLIWLTVGLFGLAGQAGTLRRDIAPRFEETARARVEFAYDMLRRQIEFLSGPANCRVFVRSEFSPPSPQFEQIQEEYDRVCEFGKQLLARTPKEPPDRIEDVRIHERPQVTNIVLLDTYRSLDDALKWYTDAKARLDELKAAKQRSEFEWAVAFFAPVLIALAIGLRIAKVFGEVRIEREAARKSN